MHCLLFIRACIHHRSEALYSNLLVSWLSTQRVHQTIVPSSWPFGHPSTGSVWSHDGEIEHVHIPSEDDRPWGHPHEWVFCDINNDEKSTIAIQKPAIIQPYSRKLNFGSGYICHCFSSSFFVLYLFMLLIFQWFNVPGPASTTHVSGKHYVIPIRYSLASYPGRMGTRLSIPMFMFMHITGWYQTVTSACNCLVQWSSAKKSSAKVNLVPDQSINIVWHSTCCCCDSRSHVVVQYSMPQYHIEKKLIRQSSDEGMHIEVSNKLYMHLWGHSC